MNELNAISASQLAENIRKKKVSSEEVVSAYLNRLEEVNPILNAVIQMRDPADVLAEARNADAAVAKKKPLGKLHGIPVTIKDTCKVKGLITSCGCQGLYGQKSFSDATIVARLRAEGAIILGLTNVPELLLCPETDNKLYGRTNNPYRIDRTPGGSSGGEAAIIAAGGSSLGIGSDAGGSIRQPAHCCGIAGLKPTQGLLPNTGNILGEAPGIFSGIVTFGPMARYVEDLILTLPILAGPDGFDPHVVPVPLKNPLQVALKSLRVAFYTENGVVTPTPEIAQTVKNAAIALAPYVASIEENCPQGYNKTVQLLWETIFLAGDQGEGLLSWLKSVGVTHPSACLQDFLERAKRCHFSVTDLRKRLVELDRFRNEMLSFMKDYDVIICPAFSTPARPHGMGFHKEEDFTYTMSFNITGWPAVVVRCGTSSDGLPIGVQVVAKAWCDDIALATAKKLEYIFGGWQPPEKIT
jgi:amidase